MVASIVHFTVVCLVAKPLNRNEAKGDLVMIQTLLLFKCKLLCYHANKILVSITTRSPSASLQIKGLATKCTTVKWPIVTKQVLPCNDLLNNFLIFKYRLVLLSLQMSVWYYHYHCWQHIWDIVLGTLHCWIVAVIYGTGV